MQLTDDLSAPVPANVPTINQPGTARSALSVTAIIPTFNRSNYLGEAIRGLLRQSRPVDQLIIVDDGSTDDTPLVAVPCANEPKSSG